MDEVKRYLDHWDYNDPLYSERISTVMLLVERFFADVDSKDRRGNCKRVAMYLLASMDTYTNLDEIETFHRMLRAGKLMWNEDNRVTEIVWKKG